MNCQKCGKNVATYHSIKNVNGVVSEIYLCSSCARNSGDIDDFSVGQKNNINQDEIDIVKFLVDNYSLAPKTFGINIADVVGFAGLDGIAEIFNTTNQSHQYQAKLENTACQSCGTTLVEFKKTLYAGCPNCYKQFENVLLQMLSTLQGATSHVGAMPNGSSDKMIEYQDIQNEIKRAVAEQRYEDAAILQKRLKDIMGTN